MVLVRKASHVSPFVVQFWEMGSLMVFYSGVNLFEFLGSEENSMQIRAQNLQYVIIGAVIFFIAQIFNTLAF